MNLQLRVIASFVILSCLFSCSDQNTEADETIVVKAFDETLTQNDINALLGPSMSKQDSLLVAKGYIDNWLQKQVLLNMAKESEIGNSNDINKKVEDFRQDLIAFEYRKKLLSENLDTNITAKETRDYYDAHSENFELKQNILRFVFVKMPVALESKYKLWSKFGKADAEELSEIGIMALKNGGNVFLESEKWVSFDDILKVVPINTYNQESFINNNRLFKIDEEKFTWFVKIIDFRIKDNISPFEFVEDNIHEILLNKRKVEILNKLENELVLKAIKENQIKVYIPKYE